MVFCVVSSSAIDRMNLPGIPSVVSELIVHDTNIKCAAYLFTDRHRSILLLKYRQNRRRCCFTFTFDVRTTMIFML